MFPLMIGSAVGVAVALILTGCSDNSDRSSIAPTLGPTTVTVGPTVTSISVNVGSTRGGMPIELTGTGLRSSASVTFGTATVTSTRYDPRAAPSTLLVVDTPAHAAGVVDVIVTNLDGQTFRLNRGYEFVPQEAFDLNGVWDGVTTDGGDTFVQFTIKNNVLVTASCEGQGKATVALSGQVSDGEFSVGGPDAFLLSGRIVAASVAVGKIMAPACFISISPWHAFKLSNSSVLLH